MDLVPLARRQLDAYGLVAYPWVVRDPENARHSKNVTAPFLIRHHGQICGFMTRRVIPGKFYLDYLVFAPAADPQLVQEFCQTIIGEIPAMITTYTSHWHQSVWEGAGFQIRPGHLWMERDVTLMTAGESTSTIEMQPVPWPAGYDMLRDLYRSCFPAEEWSYLDDFRTDSLAKTAAVFVAKHHHVPVALLISVEVFDNSCFICWLGVRPEWRRHGIGGALMHFGVNAARHRGLLRLGLLVRPENTAAIRFYEQYGFRTIWQRIHLRRG